MKRVLVAGLLAVLGVATLVAPARAVDVISPSSYFLTMSGHNAPFIGGDDYLWRNGDGSELNVRQWVANALQIDVESGVDTDETYVLWFYPKAGDTLTVGDYPDALNYPDSTHAGLSVQRSGASCASATGHFTVKDLAPDWSHAWITYEVSCDGQGSVSGEVRYGLPDTDPDLTVAPGDVTVPEVGVRERETVAVNLINTGSSPVTVSSAVASGDDEFAVVGSTCSVIAVGAACRVSVEFAPTVSGHYSGTLTVTDSTTAGTHAVPLDGNAVTLPVSGSITLDQSAAYKYGQTVTATATLSGTWVDPTVSIYTQVGANPKQLVSTAGVDADGEVQVQVPIKVQTKFILEWSDGNQSGSDMKIASVLPVTIAIGTDHSVGEPYRYGQAAKVTVTLTGAPTRTVKLYKTVGEGARQFVTSATVSASTGKVVISVPVRARTKFAADWVDGATTKTSPPKTVQVFASVTETMTNYSRISSGYAIYAPGKSMWSRAVVLPARSDRCVYFAAQVYSGGWQTFATTGCIRTTSTGAARAYLPYDSDLRGRKIRFRASFKGDEANYATFSAWKYAKWPA